MANDSGWVLAILGVVIVWAVVGHSENVSPVTSYPVAVSNCNQQGRCTVKALDPIDYRIDRDHQNVIWFDETSSEIRYFSECEIWDRENWRCDDGLYEMIDGVRKPNLSDQTSGVRFVPWYRWYLYKWGITLSQPITRTSPLARDFSNLI